MKTNWYYAIVKDNAGREIETRVQAHNKSEAYEKITADPAISKYNPDLKPAQVHKSKTNY